MPAGELPALAPIPGGNANVFIRSLGLPADPIDATGHILAAISGGQTRSIGLGLAGEGTSPSAPGSAWTPKWCGRWKDCAPTAGKPRTRCTCGSPSGSTTRVTDRRHPALTLERDGHRPVDHVFLGVVSNTAPWTYLGRRPVNPSPLASFGSGLDVFALRRMRTVSTLNVIRQMLSGKNGPPNGRHVLSLHDEPGLTLRSDRPIALQVDGEYMGEREVCRHSARYRGRCG